MKSSLVLAVVLSFPFTALATTFFASNNTEQIDLQTAFDRLNGNQQQALHKVFFKYLSQGKQEDLLGTYQAQDKKITADNSEAFTTVLALSNQHVFALAKELASALKQETVAVFIPSQQHAIGDSILTFTAHHYSINGTIALLKAKLPAQYTQAFSLHLNTHGNFNNAEVMEVEWLGSKIKPEIIKKSFPLDIVSYQYGGAYLVYQNGKKQQL